MRLTVLEDRFFWVMAAKKSKVVAVTSPVKLVSATGRFQLTFEVELIAEAPGGESHLWQVLSVVQLDV